MELKLVKGARENLELIRDSEKMTGGNEMIVLRPIDSCLPEFLC